jgi:undecaprenyl-diphosphatase
MRAYVPWYLVRNYVVFALVVCLGALQFAQARSRARPHWRAHAMVALAVVVTAFFLFYALAPELLTPGPAGGEMVFLFGGAALLAVGVTRGMGYWGLGIESQRSDVGGQKAEAESGILKFEIWYLIFPILSAVVFLFDGPLFRVLNGLALCTPLMDTPVQFLMNDYIVPTALVLILLALWFAGRGDDERAGFQRTVLRALLTLALASVTLKLINEVYFRPRPFTFDKSVRLLFYHPSDSAMPSNAATVCFSLAIAVWLRQRRWGAVMLALAVGMTLARVIGGVHYPADVVVGAWLGGVWAWLVDRAVWLDRPLSVISDRLSMISGQREAHRE